MISGRMESLQDSTRTILSVRVGKWGPPSIRGFRPQFFARKSAFLATSRRQLRPVWPSNPFDRDADDWGFHFSPALSVKSSATGHGPLVDEDDALLAMRLACEAASPGLVDPSAFVANRDLPNVILIIFESFRHSTLGPDLMKSSTHGQSRGYACSATIRGQIVPTSGFSRCSTVGPLSDTIRPLIAKYRPRCSSPCDDPATRPHS